MYATTPHSFYVVPSSPSFSSCRTSHLTAIATTIPTSTAPHACATCTLFFPPQLAL